MSEKDYRRDTKEGAIKAWNERPYTSDTVISLQLNAIKEIQKFQNDYVLQAMDRLSTIFKEVLDDAIMNHPKAQDGKYSGWCPTCLPLPQQSCDDCDMLDGVPDGYIRMPVKSGRKLRVPKVKLTPEGLGE